MIVRYMITCFGTTFETFTEIESFQGPTTLYGRLPFSIEFQGFVKKKRIKYIHQNLIYYETIEQIHFMVVKK
jgi:hypothetical protein